MKTKAERIQDDTYAEALTVEAALVDSLSAIKAAKDALAAGEPVSPVLLETAVDSHRGAHVRWENLVVSENSMGFHNPSEVTSELTTALILAQSASEDAEAGTNCGPGCGSAAGAVPDGHLVPGIPLTLSLNEGGDLELSWSASCRSGDTDFAIYEGSLGDFTSHEPGACSTGESTTAVFEPGPGNTYYLVVPHNAIWEGSYGHRGDGTERPRGALACFSQAIAVCE